MKRTDNLQQAAVPLNNYQFDFGLPGMPKPSGSLKDQQKAQLKSTSQSSAGWSASPGGWGSSQSGSDQAFDFLGRSNGGGASNPNVGPQVRPQMVGNVSSTYDFLGKPNPMGAGGGGGYYGSKPQVGNVGGMNSFLSQTGSQAKGGVDLSGKSWGQTTASKLASAGIPGYKPSSKEDVFGDLLGGALGGKSSAPLKQQQAASSAGAYGMSNVQSAMPEVTKAQVQEKPAKPAPFSYTAMFKSPTPPAQKPAPKPQARAGDPFADISFSKPANGPSTDPFDFGVKKQTAPLAPAPAPAPVSAARTPSSDPFGSFAGVDQFDSIFGSAPAAKVAQAHDGWGDAFGATAESNSFADEGVTTELEGLGAAPPGVTGSSASQKGSTFYKEGQFPNAIKWFSWAVELLEKEKASKDAIIEVLTKRISCFKEIGEMKKAIADCTKACDLKPGCVELLMLRAHLYESCEKIKLGVADLREVLKIEPSHRLASQTVARLERML